MRHVFRCRKMGWKKEMECIWFDSNYFTKEEAEAQFHIFEDINQNGYPYKGYEYQGTKYHDIQYLGEYEDDKMPQGPTDYFNHLKNKKKTGSSDE